MKRVAIISFIASVLFCLSFIPKAKKVIVIDVGHGGIDRGSIHGELSEKDIVLEIAQKVQELNSSGKLDIILTREIDHFVELEERVNFANRQTPSFFLSLHTNYAAKDTISGFEIYVKNNSLAEQSMKMASAIEREYPNQIQKRQITTANFHVLKKSNCPSVLLELGFLSNENDRNYLLSEAGQWEIAAAIYNAVK